MSRPRVCTGPWQRKAVYLWRGLCSLRFLGKHCHAGFVTQQNLAQKGKHVIYVVISDTASQ